MYARICVCADGVEVGTGRGPVLLCVCTYLCLC